MKIRYWFPVVLAAFLVLSIHSVSEGAINTRQISVVCEKEVLDSVDFGIIDNFVAEAVDELVDTEDFGSISKIRTILLLYSNSKKASAATQYSTQFSDSSYKYISKAFNDAETISSSERKYKVVLNLLILVDSLQDIRLMKFAVEKLDSRLGVVRYWAIRCISKKVILEQFNSSNPELLLLAKDIAEHLNRLVSESSPEDMVLILNFARGLNIQQCKDLVLRIADVRISRYANWNVDYELLDASVLKGLYEKIGLADEEGKRVFGRRFANLLSYIIQRYVKGRDVLSDTQKQHLASVLVDAERSCISDLVGTPKVTIKRALESDSLIVLMSEHNSLLGDETASGVLPSKLDFDYGINNDGSARIYPAVLPDPVVKQMPSAATETDG